MDEDEVKNDTRREGMFLGMSAFFTKPANSLGPIIATFVLAYFGYVTGTDIQPESALFGIKLLMFGIPPIFIALSLLFLIKYPLHGEELQVMKRALEQIHSQRLAGSASSETSSYPRDNAPNEGDTS